MSLVGVWVRVRERKEDLYGFSVMLHGNDFTLAGIIEMNISRACWQPYMIAFI